MEVDYNLKKIANTFKFFPCIVEMSLKNDYSAFVALTVLTIIQQKLYI